MKKTKFEKILLIFTTLFALMFIFTYFYNVNQFNQLTRLRKVVKAYELYLLESKEFTDFVKQNDLKELDWLLSKRLMSEIRSKLDKAKISYREGNYAESASLLREIKDSENPWMDEIYFYLGMSLYRIGELESAKLFLSSFLDNFQYSIYRKESLLILKEISSEDLKKQIDKILSEQNSKSLR
ncbi:MAG: tetratricopeptide repeat protein [Fervidobacterium sp.]|nr:tetratricopeptide repeat protein [Fervidobacterium sp.]